MSTVSILVLRGNKESAGAVNQCQFCARSPLEQQLDHVHMSVLRGHKQRRGPVSLHLQHDKNQQEGRGLVAIYTLLKCKKYSDWREP